MTVFDLIFIAVFFAFVVLVLAIGVAAVRGQRGRALGLLGWLVVFVAVYLGMVIFASMVSPRRTVESKEARCFDDWCISVDRVDRTAAGGSFLYTVSLRMHSRALRRPQRENGVSLYVLDELGRRYEPQEDPQAVPLNVLLNPGDSVVAVRRFSLPVDARNPGLVVAHGRFPGMFIIGDDQSLFHKPTLIRLTGSGNGTPDE